MNASDSIKPFQDSTSFMILISCENSCIYCLQKCSLAIYIGGIFFYLIKKEQMNSCIDVNSIKFIGKLDRETHGYQMSWSTVYLTLQHGPI